MEQEEGEEELRYIGWGGDWMRRETRVIDTCPESQYLSRIIDDDDDDDDDDDGDSGNR